MSVYVFVCRLCNHVFFAVHLTDQSIIVLRLLQIFCIEAMAEISRGSYSVISTLNV